MPATNKKSIAVSIFPNPVSSVFAIDAGTGILKEVFIFTATGEVVFHSTAPKSKLEVNATSFANGIYIYKAYLNNGTEVTGKIIKE